MFFKKNPGSIFVFQTLINSGNLTGILLSNVGIDLLGYAHLQDHAKDGPRKSDSKLSE